MISRRTFIRQAAVLGAAIPVLSKHMADARQKPYVMTVNGPMDTAKMGFTLTHEHVLADFIGAAKYSHERYDATEVFDTALPYLMDVKKRGCATFVDCSPVYLGRDVKILKRLADATGLNIVTNTGYYGAVNEKFLPANAYTESAEQIASRWIDEWRKGIEGTSIKPGFIKTSVDNAPLSPTQRKVVMAAAIAHMQTGLTIAIHTGDGKAATEELGILRDYNVSPSAWIWVHAQKEPDGNQHIAAAKAGGWISFEDVRTDNIQPAIDFLQRMKSNNVLTRALISHDAGWYNVGEPKGGAYRNYNAISDILIPQLRANNFTQAEIDTIFIHNPARAFAIEVRKR